MELFVGSSADKSPEVLERRSISYNDKKSKKKKKTQSLDVVTPETPSVHEHEKRSLNFKSFRKMAKLVKTSQSVSIRNSIAEEDTDGGDEVFEEEKEEESRKEGEEGGDKHSSSSKAHPRRPPPPTTASPISPMSESDQQKSRKKRPPPRPSDIALRQQESQEQQQQLSTGVTPGVNSVSFSIGEGSSTRKNKRPVPQPHGGEDSSARSSSRSTPPHDINHSPCRLTTRSQFSRAYLEADNEFFVINHIHMCLCGLWLCVANEGGKVLAFDFTTTPQEHPTQVCLGFVAASE